MNRIDRHEIYLAVLLAALIASVKALPGIPVAVGPLRFLATETQYLICVSMIVGCPVALIGAALGAPLLKQIPLRFCYLIGAGGLVAVEVAMGVLAVGVRRNDATTGEWNWAFSQLLFIALAVTMVRLYRAYRRLTREVAEFERR